MKKQQSNGFGKKVYLLGKDKDGIKYWLEEPKWDCDWYWGFGYIETYTNNDNPSKSKDIDLHQHAEDFKKFCVNWNDSKPILTETTFNENEGWEISDLFASFYALREVAEIYHRGHSNCTANESVSLKDIKQYKHINDVLIPKITKRIIDILTPIKGE